MILYVNGLSHCGSPFFVACALAVCSKPRKLFYKKYIDKWRKCDILYLSVSYD